MKKFFLFKNLRGRSHSAWADRAGLEPTRREQTPLTSVLAVADSLRGVSVHEGDPFGFDDWSTTVSVRGFQLNLHEQQLGITVDGLPNGNSGSTPATGTGRHRNSVRCPLPPLRPPASSAGTSCHTR